LRFSKKPSPGRVKEEVSYFKMTKIRDIRKHAEYSLYRINIL